MRLQVRRGGRLRVFSLSCLGRPTVHCPLLAGTQLRAGPPACFCPVAPLPLSAALPALGAWRALGLGESQPLSLPLVGPGILCAPILPEPPLCLSLQVQLAWIPLGCFLGGLPGPPSLGSSHAPRVPAPSWWSPLAGHSGWLPTNVHVPEAGTRPTLFTLDAVPSALWAPRVYLRRCA